jgi:hypothetical protein
MYFMEAGSQIVRGLAISSPPTPNQGGLRPNASAKVSPHSHAGDFTGRTPGAGVWIKMGDG